MNYLFILGVALIIFGIIFVITYLKESYGKYCIIKGRIADEIRTVSLRGSSRRPFIGYVLIIEYPYNGKTVRVEHRIETPRPSKKYKVEIISAFGSCKEDTRRINGWDSGYSCC